jgi:anaerobic magnesium-protoporphyrin IX monomethyl ester cyclase
MKLPEKHCASTIDVLLTYPSDPVRLFDSMVPLGIASIAAVLEENSYKVKVIDFNHYTGDYRKDLAAWQPKIVGIGGTTATRRGSFLTARLTREILPGVPVVYGGPHASFTARDTLTHVLEIDYVVKGEGEYPFLALCDYFVKGLPRDLCTIPGLCFRTADDIAENPCERIDDLNSLPLPARHLFPGPYRLTLDLYDLEAEFLLTSRGCPAHCTFCSASRMFSGGVRYRSMEHIRAELDRLVATRRIEALKLFDSTFTSSPYHVAAFCDLIGRYNILWECEVRADTLNRKMLGAMKQAGCVYINVGLETANPAIMAQTAKHISAQQVEQCLRWCREVDMKTKVFMIFGHPGQTFDECRQDIAYINRHRDMIDFFATTVGMRVYPGTPLETMLKKTRS